MSGFKLGFNWGLGQLEGGVPAAPAPPNTLIAGTGAFVVLGETMTPIIDYVLPADVGAFTLAGQAAAFVTGGGSAPTFVQTGTGTAVTGTAPAYSTNVDVGAAVAGKFVAIIFTATTGTLSSFTGTIDGQTATFTNIASGFNNVEIWVATAVISGGPTVTFNLNGGNTFFGSCFMVWTCNAADLLSQTPVDKRAVQSVSSTSSTGQINTTANASVIAFYFSYAQSGLDQSFTTPNSIGVVFDQRYGFNGAAGTKNGATAQTNGTVTGTATGTGDPVMVLVSFR